MTQTSTGQNREEHQEQAPRQMEAGASSWEQQRAKELERIRRKRHRPGVHQGLRQALNMVFLLLAAVGLVLYFCSDNYHLAALAVIGAGMLFKVGEFFVRFFM